VLDDLTRLVPANGDSIRKRIRNRDYDRLSFLIFLDFLVPTKSAFYATLHELLVASKRDGRFSDLQLHLRYT